MISLINRALLDGADAVDLIDSDDYRLTGFDVRD